ncbi:MAG: protein kinase [Luminiphilus sp.]|nr:protein kinase [Luminiphilus sp.]
MSWLSRFKALGGRLGSLRRMAFLDHLGLGGQGEVLLARDRLFSRLVTVKKVEVADASSRGTLRSLQARVDVTHPAIPTVFAVIPDGRNAWLVGEFVKGLPLSEIVAELSPESIYLIARDLLSAIGCLERLGLVHGDFSPNNVVVDVNGQVRLLDFESCSRVGQPLFATATIGFSAPERHTRKVSLPTIDTWSVGALIIWLITQAAPSVVYDEARKPVSVEFNEGRNRADMLSDLLNLAVAATRIDPDLRPSATDLQQKLKLSYRWLEPLSRTNLATVVQTRTPRAPLPKTVFDFPEWQGERQAWSSLKWSLPVAALTVLSLAAYQPVHSYSLSLDTSDVSPATALPSSFDDHWVRGAFNTSLPSAWTQTQAANSEEISMAINCDRGVCELLLEHLPEESVCLHHSAVINTDDERVWRAAFTDLARALSIE